MSKSKTLRKTKQKTPIKRNSNKKPKSKRRKNKFIKDKKSIDLYASFDERRADAEDNRAMIYKIARRPLSDNSYMTPYILSDKSDVNRQSRFDSQTRTGYTTKSKSKTLKGGGPTFGKLFGKFKKSKTSTTKPSFFKSVQKSKTPTTKPSFLGKSVQKSKVKINKNMIGSPVSSSTIRQGSTLQHEAQRRQHHLNAIKLGKTKLVKPEHHIHWRNIEKIKKNPKRYDYDSSQIKDMEVHVLEHGKLPEPIFGTSKQITKNMSSGATQRSANFESIMNRIASGNIRSSKTQLPMKPPTTSV